MREAKVKLAQSRIVTTDVERLAKFYAELVGEDVVVNEYYVEEPAGGPTVGISRVRYTDFGEPACGPPHGVGAGELILDFATDDLDGEFARVEALGVEWVMYPTLQPWGRRSMMFRDPDGHLLNLFSTDKEDRS